MQVYLLTNTITHKRYIGKTSVGLSRRWTVHKSKALNEGVDSHLYRSIRKHGAGVFAVELLEYDISKEDINDRERFWIAELQPEYNMTAGGDGGDMSHLETFKKSMHDYHANKPREEYATYGMLGKRQTKEAITKTAEAKHRRCVVEGKEFPSQKAAEAWLKEMGIKGNIRKKFDNPKYPNYYRIDGKRNY